MGTLWTSKACYLTHHPGLTAGPWRELWSLWNSCCWRWWWGSLWGPGCDKWPSDHMWSPLKEPGVRRRRWSDALFVMRKTKKFHNLHEFIWTVKMQRCDWNLTVDISHTSLFNVRILDSCICERLLTWRGMKTQCWDTHDTLSNKVHIDANHLWCDCYIKHLLPWPCRDSHSCPWLQVCQTAATQQRSVHVHFCFSTLFFFFFK